jgi:putative membrane protein
LADNLSGWRCSGPPANPHDYLTWILEAFPALIGPAVLAATRKHFPLTPLAYGLILLHCWILFLGAHYT